MIESLANQTSGRISWAYLVHIDSLIFSSFCCSIQTHTHSMTFIHSRIHYRKFVSIQQNSQEIFKGEAIFSIIMIEKEKRDAKVRIKWWKIPDRMYPSRLVNFVQCFFFSSIAWWIDSTAVFRDQFISQRIFLYINFR